MLFVQTSLPALPLLLTTLFHLILVLSFPLTVAIILSWLVRDCFKLFGWGRGGVAEAENGQHEKQQRGDVLGGFGFEGGNDGLGDEHEVEEDLAVEEGEPMGEEDDCLGRVGQICEEGAVGEYSEEEVGSRGELVPDVLEDDPLAVVIALQHLLPQVVEVEF